MCNETVAFLATRSAWTALLGGMAVTMHHSQVAMVIAGEALVHASVSMVLAYYLLFVITSDTFQWCGGRCCDAPRKSWPRNALSCSAEGEPLEVNDSMTADKEVGLHSDSTDVTVLRSDALPAVAEASTWVQRTAIRARLQGPSALAGSTGCNLQCCGNDCISHPLHFFLKVAVMQAVSGFLIPGCDGAAAAETRR